MAKTKSWNVSGNIVGLFTADAFTGGAVFDYADAILGHAFGDPGNQSLSDDTAKFGKTFLDPVKTDPMGTVTKTGLTAIGGSLLAGLYRKATKGGIVIFGHKLR